VISALHMQADQRGSEGGALSATPCRPHAKSILSSSRRDPWLFRSKSEVAMTAKLVVGRLRSGMVVLFIFEVGCRHLLGMSEDKLGTPSSQHVHEKDPLSGAQPAL
jgi:hypothetical protein